MSRTFKAYLFSFIIHTAVLFSLLLFWNRDFDKSKRPVEIDLSLVEFQKSSFEEPQERREGFKTRGYTLPAHVEYKRQEIAHQEKEKEVRAEAKKLSERIAREEETFQNTNDATLRGFGEEAPETRKLGNSAVLEDKARQDARGVGSLGAREETQKTETALSSLELQRDMFLKEKLFVISHIVQRNITYPPLARKMGWEGKVVLSICIDEDGTLKEVRVLESSGYEVLDRNAIETVKRVAGLFPKPPVEVVVKLPVRYRLE
ncbi:MAG: energy transducer TonB [Aquificaceae bacterium]|nr:energy transducer TonB [Aquificaceae bacterium]MDW8423169.1 energy transducer TonB [Aquificaceae bacterium]